MEGPWLPCAPTYMSDRDRHVAIASSSDWKTVALPTTRPETNFDFTEPSCTATPMLLLEPLLTVPHNSCTAKEKLPLAPRENKCDQHLYIKYGRV